MTCPTLNDMVSVHWRWFDSLVGIIGVHKNDINYLYFWPTLRLDYTCHGWLANIRRPPWIPTNYTEGSPNHYRIILQLLRFQSMTNLRPKWPMAFALSLSTHGPLSTPLPPIANTSTRLDRKSSPICYSIAHYRQQTRPFRSWRIT